MKQNFSLLIVLLFFFSINSQNNFKLGVNLGGQYTDLRGFEFPVDSDFEIGFSYGVNIEYGITKNLSVVSGINFEQINKKVELTFFDFNANVAREQTVKEKYKFFNVPLLVRWKFGNKKQFFVDGGAFMNYFNKAEPNEFTPLFINFEDYNYGVAFGLGTIIPFGNNMDVTLQLRNDLGLTDINKFDNQIPGEIKTNTLRFIATCNFGF